MESKLRWMTRLHFLLHRHLESVQLNQSRVPSVSHDFSILFQHHQTKPKMIWRSYRRDRVCELYCSQPPGGDRDRLCFRGAVMSSIFILSLDGLKHWCFPAEVCCVQTRWIGTNFCITRWWILKISGLLKKIKVWLKTVWRQRYLTQIIKMLNCWTSTLALLLTFANEVMWFLINITRIKSFSTTEYLLQVIFFLILFIYVLVFDVVIMFFLFIQKPLNAFPQNSLKGWDMSPKKEALTFGHGFPRGLMHG